MRLRFLRRLDGRAPAAAALRPGKRAALLLVLAAALFALSGCAALKTLVGDAAPATSAAAGPNLNLLDLPAYDDPDASDTGVSASGAEYMPVDLWLDATQTMGGIDTNDVSMYPHTGKKYREGGFHYRYGAQTGWYESLLRDFLAAAGETRVRALRFGNETMPDAFLASYGLSADSDEAAASIWRDLHTVATDANERLFSQFSAEDMAGSFYSLGSPAWLNRQQALDPTALENPALAPAMDAALSAQTLAISEGQSGFVLDGGADGAACAFLTALRNIDASRLSVITVDPAAMRKLAGSDASGKPLAYYEQALRDLGVFDRGLCVGVLDFQLDYLGQMSTFTTAALSEPLVWGRVILDEKKQTFERLGVMPRRLITLVIGTRARVNALIERLGEAIDSDRTLKGLRGPENGELTYAAEGETVTQQPFAFEWNHTVIARPGMGYYTQHTEGSALSVAGADDAEPTQAGTGADGLPQLTLTADANGTMPDAELTVRLPVEKSADGATLDVSHLTGARIQPVVSLLLAQTLPNTPANAADRSGQTIAYRDALYRFTLGAEADAFTLESVVREGDELVCRIDVHGDRLKSGFYRLLLAADATGDQVAWETVPWIDGEHSVSAAVTDAEVYAWETFAAAATEYDRDTKGLPKMFQHAWGPYTDKLYHGLRVPDFPPVYRSVGLSELVGQIRAAAASDTSPLIRYAFELRAEGF